ncbi:MAG TPA: DUF1801 domain-containing protein [Streptosporangiaceae bacterium]|nr:DUF1801 domain-containing protein [Streptosporangiaceae bacterium]
MAATKKSTTGQAFDGFTEDERAAMKEHAKEMKASARRSGSKTAQAEAEADVLAKIAEMADSDRVLAERLHAIVKDTAPELAARTWYGMPAYAKDGKVVCFFKPAQKFKVRYAELGFSDPARLDDGPMWPTVYALTELTPDVEARIADLVKKAVS